MPCNRCGGTGSPFVYLMINIVILVGCLLLLFILIRLDMLAQILF